MKIKTLIIDDEPLAHEVILQLAKDVPQLEVVGQCYQAIEALEFLKKQPTDLIFLDINMPKIDGLDFLRILDQKPQVIITSAYQEYALESYELDVCDYLLKPFRFDRFLKAVHKAEERLKLQSKDSASAIETTQAGTDQLFIKEDKRYIQLNIPDIYYLEGQGNYVKVWLNDRFHLAAQTLSSFEEQLPADQFIRIHKSFIINRRHVHYLEGNQLVMQNEKELLIGRSFRQEVKELLTKQF